MFARRLSRIALTLLVVVASGLWLAALWLTALPEARHFPAPAKTRWAPSAPRTPSGYDYSAIPEPDAFHTMHVDTRNSDEIWSAVAPEFTLDWWAEPQLYVAEGPTFDNEGNLYFSPVSPQEDVSLVSLDARSGKRRWSVAGAGAGCGAPLILNDPDAPGHQQIFHSTYTQATALRPDGSAVWSVATGLAEPERLPGARDLTHTWGMSYHAQTDSVFSVTMDGFVIAHDRRTGARRLRTPFRLPGAPAALQRQLPVWLARRANRETDAVFGATRDGIGLFSSILDVVFGSGVNVANTYAIAPETGLLYIAATAPDAQDGSKDGVSRNGAIYAIEVRAAGEWLELAITRSFAFEGGTGSSPTWSREGLFVSDDNGYVIALDAELRERWRAFVGSQVAASIAVSADAHELYAVTRYDVIQLIDEGSAGRIGWRAKLDAYPGFANFNALTPTLTANGVLVSVGAGRNLGSQQLILRFGMGLLDRQTGALRWFAEGREESIAVSAVGPAGSVYTAGSPVRRAVARALLGDALPPLVGGIHRYRPLRVDLLARDAACAAEARAAVLARSGPLDAGARRDDLGQLRVLSRQARSAIPEALAAGDLEEPLAGALASDLRAADAALAQLDAAGAAQGFGSACRRFD